MSPTAISLSEIRRALVWCPNWLGDTVMAVPTVRALRSALPEPELWCLGRWAGAVLEEEPGITRRLDFPRAWRARLRLTRALRRAAIDLVLLLPNSFGTALSAWLTGARWRIGYAGDGRSGFLTHPVRPGTAPIHQIDAYLALLGPLGVTPPMRTPTLRVSAARRDEARRLLSDVGIRPGDRAVAIQLGAAFGPSKLWPVDRLAALAARLDHQGLRAVFVGSPSAEPLLRAVQAKMSEPSRSLVGRDHPALLPALLAEFAVVVAPDSGPGHVAAAVGVPVVTLFGPTDARLTAPIGDRTAWLWRQPVCAPCFQPRCPIDHRCMNAITVDEVASVILAWLEPRAGAGGERTAP